MTPRSFPPLPSNVRSADPRDWDAALRAHGVEIRVGRGPAPPPVRTASQGRWCPASPTLRTQGGRDGRSTGCVFFAFSPAALPRSRSVCLSLQPVRKRADDIHPPGRPQHIARWKAPLRPLSPSCPHTYNRLALTRGHVRPTSSSLGSASGSHGNVVGKSRQSRSVN